MIRNCLFRASQFYLVLDVVNLTTQEMLFNYTSGKNIVIEAKESCRVPVPVERCPIERLQPENDEHADDLQPSKSLQFHIYCHTEFIIQISYLIPHPAGSMMYVVEANYPERACSNHISDQVNLKWSLLNTEINGKALLKGITLSSAMLSLITVAPLQWRKQTFSKWMKNNQISKFFFLLRPYSRVIYRNLYWWKPIATTDWNQMLHWPMRQIRCWNLQFIANRTESTYAFITILSRLSKWSVQLSFGDEGHHIRTGSVSIHFTNITIFWHSFQNWIQLSRAIKLLI